mgnify:FL=1
MNILVTGGSGYIGSKLVERLAKTNHYVTVYETQIFGNPIEHLASDRIRFVEGDIRNPKKLKTQLSRIDVAVHLAGVVTDELVDMNPTFGSSVNIDGTRNVIKACKWNGVRRLIYASSSSVYGSTAQDVVPDEGHTPEPQTQYAKQKLKGERLVMDYEGEKTAVRQATAMGPAPRMRLDTVVNIFSKQAYYDGVITPYGGEQYRSNIHVADTAELYLKLIEADKERIDGQVWNWTDENLPVKEIAYRVAEVARSRGIKCEVKLVNIKDERSYRLNADKAKRLLGISPQRGVAGAAADNFDFFKTSGIDPNDDVYFNNRRMADVVKGV